MENKTVLVYGTPTKHQAVQLALMEAAGFKVERGTTRRNNGLEVQFIVYDEVAPQQEEARAPNEPYYIAESRRGRKRW